MAEENLEQLIFFDTNVLLLNSNWELYADHLNQNKEGTSNPSDIINIDPQKVDKANYDIAYINEILRSNLSQIRIPRGVEKQTLKKIDDIVEKIDQRKNNYLFLKFSDYVSDNKKQNAEDIFGKTMEYKRALLDMREMVGESRYQRPNDDTYQTLFNLLNAMHYHFNIGKEDQEPDFNADKGLGLSVVYEAIRGKQVSLYSNDGDVNDTVAAAYSLLSEMRLLDESGHLEFFYQHPPTIYKVPQNRSNGEDAINISSKGSNIITTLKESQGESRKGYSTRVGKFALFLETIMDDLQDSFQTYQESES